MARMDPTHRLAQQINDAFNRIDFDPSTVAALVVAQAPPHVRVMAYRLAYHIIRVLAVQYDYGNFGSNDDETRAVIKAAKAFDYMDSID